MFDSDISPDVCADSGMPHESFLGAVASAYLHRFDDLSEFCFLFPNKRSGSFFLKNLSDRLEDTPILAPCVLGVDEFMAKVAQRYQAPRIDLIFRLYNIYCQIVGRSPNLVNADDVIEFDRFAPWGETLLSDFSEVEKYDVDAPALFRNVRDYREIASNFLSEEQIEIIARYFGIAPQIGEAERFWKNVGPEPTQSDLRRKFVELWRLLPELYSGLLDSLEKDGLALEGSLYRKAMERALKMGRMAFPWKKVVVVGFNLLSTSEARLFDELKKLRADDGSPFAEFFWDATGPVLNGRAAAPAKLLRRYIAQFPMPEWAAGFIAKSEAVSLPPKISVAASPSNTAQTKIAAIVIKEWMKNKKNSLSARDAVVLPDENLLLPMLHSLPKGLADTNLTMGYSLRYSSVASLMFHLRRLQLRRRRVGDDFGYHVDDISAFIGHPLVQLILGSSLAVKIMEWIQDAHLRVVPVKKLSELAPVIAPLITPLPRAAKADVVVQWLDSALVAVDSAIKRADANCKSDDSPNFPDSPDSPEESNILDFGAFDSNMERSYIAHYRFALNQLLSAASAHGIEMAFAGVFHLADRLLAGERISFEGKPLKGLQIMGLLETRAIDFNRIVVLSLNDKIMPRRARRRTFVPDALRRGYGLPTSSQSEILYSYYFYRLISRAKEVTLVYDARAGEGMRSGGKSRYLMQLQLLHARGSIEESAYSFGLDSSVAAPKEVVKSEAVREYLKLYSLPKEGRNLSASALMDYCVCPVRFYYRDVVGLRDETAPLPSLDAITQGLVVHKAMEQMYLDVNECGKYLVTRPVITQERILRILENSLNEDGSIAKEGKIARLVRRAINQIHYHRADEELDAELEGAVAIVAERIGLLVKNALLHDASIAPFSLIGTEIGGTFRYQVNPDLSVNVRYSIDRADIIDGHTRIVDYKTGSAHVDAKNLEDIFNGSSDAKYLLQLMLYAQILEDRMLKEEGVDAGPIEMNIYEVNSPDSVKITPTVEKQPLEAHNQEGVAEYFNENLNRIISEIFNPDIPFRPTDNPDNCKYCNLHDLCGRAKS